MPCPQCQWRGYREPEPDELGTVAEACGVDLGDESSELDVNPEDFAICNQCGHVAAVDEFMEY